MALTGLLAPSDIPHIARIVRLYRLVNGREPDEDGLVTYVRSLRDGKPLEAIAAIFLGSGEHRARADAAAPLTPAGVVDTIEAGERDGPLNVLDMVFPHGLGLDDPIAYAWWIGQHERLHAEDIQAAAMALHGRPRLTFILPVDDPKSPGLRATAASVRAQVYPAFDLVLVPMNRRRALRRSLRALAAGDARISVASLPSKPAAPAFALTNAIATARGDLAALLSPGDVMAPHATTALAAAIQHEPLPALLYSDEDSMDAGGRRHAPVFKTAWDPETAACRNNAGRLALIATPVLRRMPALDAMAGLAAWEHRAVLDAADGGRARIIHVPAILCHRLTEDRGDTGRTGTGWQALLSAAARYLRRPPRQTMTPAHEVPPRPALPLVAQGGGANPVASIIVPTRDRADMLRACVDSILRLTEYPAFEIVILDNDSIETETHAALARMAADPRIRVHRWPGAFNWSAINNAGAALARGEVFVFLNNDTEALDGAWLGALVRQAMSPDIGAAGAKLLYPDQTIQHAGLAITADGASVHLYRGAAGTDPGYRDTLRHARTVSGVTGACLAVRRAVFEEAGGFEERHLAIASNDLDFCFRVRARGRRVVHEPRALLLHVELATRGRDATPEQVERVAREQAYLHATWPDFLAADPYVNPSLEAWEGPLRLASRPRWALDRVIPRASR